MINVQEIIKFSNISVYKLSIIKTNNLFNKDLKDHLW